ncbi:MAG: metallophosphoesterase [Ignavibacteriales bacterium]|nr:MAG: metallophosphoesterase [Ignavibacteriales bacterium]
MKIAHISDLHLNTFYSDSNLKQIKQLIKYSVENGTDHLVITGDLTDNASEKDFEILRNLFKKNGLLDSERMSIVIGNHDIFGGLQTAEDIFSFPERCKMVDYDSMINLFVSYFKETFENCVYKSEESHFPFAKIINDTLVTGINSIARYSKVKNPFASNGEVDIHQFNDVVRIFESNQSVKNKIVLIHHYFNKLKINKKKSASTFWQGIEKQTMKLRKKGRLFNLFNQYNVNLVLHGHLHESIEYHRKGIRFSNSGGSIKSAAKNSIAVNFINVTDEGISTEVHSIRDFTMSPLILKPQQIKLVGYEDGIELSEAVVY